MTRPLVLLSIPGLREKDVAVMRSLRRLTAGGEIAELVPGFPCVTCTVQANMTTGRTPAQHGVVANGFFWRDRQRVEMWTSPNDCIERPQIWDVLSHHDETLTSAVWFPLHSKLCEADYVCTPAPIHNPDGSESLWCWTRPAELYGTLRDRFGHFPLQHFWGPLAGIQSTAWIVDSAIYAAEQFKPAFSYVYLPHLDYAAQKTGPDSAAADQAVADLDEQIGRLATGMKAAYGRDPLWLIAGEYTIVPVKHVSYPNRLLREAGLLAVQPSDIGEEIDLPGSQAFAMVDHQCSHVFVRDSNEQLIRQVADLFRGKPGIDDVLVGVRRGEHNLEHPRAGDVVLVSTPDSWQAYYWWFDDQAAPAYARSVDIHRKPGYDPVELFFDPATRSIPLNAALVKGSHGSPAVDSRQRTVVLASEPVFMPGTVVRDTDVFSVVMKHFGVNIV